MMMSKEAVHRISQLQKAADFLATRTPNCCAGCHEACCSVFSQWRDLLRWLFGVWEEEDTEAALAVAGAAFTVALAYYLFEKS